MTNARKNAHLQLDGLTCEGCVASVTKALQQINGVKSLAVDLACQQADVLYNPEQTSVSVLLEAIEDAGFDASVIDDIKE